VGAARVASRITPTELYLLRKSIEVQRVAIIIVPLNFKQRLFMSVLIVAYCIGTCGSQWNSLNRVRKAEVSSAARVRFMVSTIAGASEHR
jgi:hypothetical protein